MRLDAASVCPLCRDAGGTLVFQGEKFRVIRAQESGFPAFYRLIWGRHVVEFSDLTPDEHSLCMLAVCAIERVLREHLQPTKINLAALGNVVAHLHWHVIARFDWDSHFPAPVWAPPLRAVDARATGLLQARLAGVENAIRTRLAAMRPAL